MEQDREIASPEKQRFHSTSPNEAAIYNITEASAHKEANEED
jgi:hypothetical protein